MILFDRKILNKKDIKIFYIKIKMYRKFIYFCSTNQLFINYKKNYIMSGINKVILVGNLGKDPEVRTIDNGTKVARFSLATTETYRDKSGERRDMTEWHNIVCWRNLAEIAEKYLTKGKQIYVEGKIKNRTWEDNGTKKYMTEIVADTFTMLGTRASDEYQKPVSEPEEKTTETSDLPPFLAEDDLPF